jgi:hypothetical protein
LRPRPSHHPVASAILNFPHLPPLCPRIDPRNPPPSLPITAYFAFIGQHGSSYYYFNAPFDSITRSLSTPDVTASYNSATGYSPSTNRYVFPIPSRFPRRNAA